MLIICLAVSCRQPKDLVYQNVQNFKMEQNAISMDVRLYNPNKYKMKLKRADLDLYLNGSHVGKVANRAMCTVGKCDTFDMPISLAVDYQNVLPNALQLLFNSEMEVQLKGNVKAGRHGIYLNIPVDYKGKQDIRSGIKL